MTLQPGSALFIPAGWWHAVVSLNATVSLGLRGVSRCERLAAWPDDVLNALHRLGLYKPHDCTCHTHA